MSEKKTINEKDLENVNGGMEILSIQKGVADPNAVKTAVMDNSVNGGVQPLVNKGIAGNKLSGGSLQSNVILC